MNQKSLRRFASTYGIYIVIALCIVIFLVPVLVRFGNGAPITPGSESYSYLRQADLLLEGDIYDFLKGSVVFQTPYTALLTIMQLLGAPWLLPVLLGILFIMLLRSYLLRILRSPFIVFISLVAVLLAPATIVLATEHSPVFLCLSLVLGALLMRERHKVVAGMLLFLAIITSPVLGILCTLGILVRMLFISDKKESFLPIAALLVAGVWYILYSAFTGGDVLSPLFHVFRIDPQVFFEFGNPLGISIFFPLIAAYGLFSGFMKRKQLVIVAVILTFMASVVFPDLLPVLTVLLAILIGYAVAELAVRNWDLDLLRQASLSLIFCVGIFLLIVSVRERVDDHPDERFVEVMHMLQKQRHDGAVLSAPEYAPTIEYFGKRRATLSERSSQEDIERAFYSRNAGEVYDFMEETGTAYVFLTDDMVDRLFVRSDEGILFVLPNAPRFVFVSGKEDSSLWYYIPR